MSPVIHDHQHLRVATQVRYQLLITLHTQVLHLGSAQFFKKFLWVGCNFFDLAEPVMKLVTVFERRLCGRAKND